MKIINCFILKIPLTDIKISPYKIRGYIGNKFKEYILLHHHIDKHKFLYKYPLVQYKKINNNYIILGLDKGAEILKKIWSDITEFKIDNQNIKVYEKQVEYKTEEIGDSSEICEYKFLTPWIALNQENYENFKLMTLKERKIKLQKILINNIIAFCKTINYTVVNQLDPQLNVSTVNTRLKGITMNAFTGTFKINFKLPELIGLGKSVSRGFGTIIKI